MAFKAEHLGLAICNHCVADLRAKMQDGHDA
jgi:hypothetical protein